MRSWWTAALDVLLPRDCSACAAPLPLGHARIVCDACWRTFRMPVDTLCARCGIPLPLASTCTACVVHPPAYDLARSLGLYLAHGGGLNPLARAVRALKFHGHRGVATALGAPLARLVPLPRAGIVVPVPLHPSRLRERGYNQAAILARAVGRCARLPTRLRGLVRRRPTPSQAHLDAAARRANLAGAFTARVPFGGADVVLVDDVLTTGATADACARALRAAGAAQIVVLTVGRTP
jgi:ComF family protein